jgi:DNA-binding NtrC family response regulator
VSKDDTTKEQAHSVRTPRAPLPGFIVCLAGGKPTYAVHPLSGRAVTIGRGGASNVVLDDERLSRQHCSLSFSDGAFIVRDLESRNGTFADGQRLTAQLRSPSLRVVVIGGTVLLLEHDISPFGQPHNIFDPGHVAGPVMQDALDQVVDIARDGSHLLLLGESGVGKERIGRTFHENGPNSKGPYQVLDCGTIGENLWESELFGHARGSFSGASRDRAGIFETADGGTVFLDEIGNMPLDAQAKLLRAIQEREIRRVGENQVRRTNVRLVAATNADLPGRVAAGHFREDLYYRLAQGVVRVPSLRERREEIPFLVTLAIADAPLPIDSTFIEQCALRPWPGNVRELLAATQAAARIARKQGSRHLSASHLAPNAGLPLTATAARSITVASSAARVPSREEIESAVLAELRAGTDVAVIAVKLQISVATIYRYQKKHGLTGP